MRSKKMARAFADITFTESVKATQLRYGSREQNRHFELSTDPRNTLGKKDIEFIQTRDSFYQATVAENGWPYVQHRGGPIGFLKVLDERTFGYADFRGNFQYISVGNIASDERVSFILMDYVHRRRLKIWGRARIIHGADNADLLAALNDEQYDAKVERGILIHVEALEWNCSQHITQRFTEADIRQSIAPLLEENQALRERLAIYE
jgi:predicted pyridoxine 5'-phosphate oxidase superfamily flavin-nucleotide-binding protein